jgi:hypothetical protein
MVNLKVCGRDPGHESNWLRDEGDVREQFGNYLAGLDILRGEESHALWKRLFTATLGFTDAESGLYLDEFQHDNLGGSGMTYYFSEEFRDIYDAYEVADNDVLRLPERVYLFSDETPDRVYLCHFRPNFGLLASHHPLDSYFVDLAFTRMTVHYHEYRTTALFEIGDARTWRVRT